MKHLAALMVLSLSVFAVTSVSSAQYVAKPPVAVQKYAAKEAGKFSLSDRFSWINEIIGGLGNGQKTKVAAKNPTVGGKKVVPLVRGKTAQPPIATAADKNTGGAIDTQTAKVAVLNTTSVQGLTEIQNTAQALLETAGVDDPPYLQPQAATARAALKALVSTSAPDTVYAAFAEFCRWHFGAKAEPLVNEVFGEDISLVEASTWRHVSENSASLAWETNVPCTTYVEYGTTLTYGSRTADTDRAYYQHMHQVKNLTINTTYHYRLVATDEWGNIFRSPDATFTTTAVAGAIYVPGNLSGPPYVLSTAKKTYILTQDITATNNAIKITADDVVLDLNGHTVTYAQNATSNFYCHGIWANGGETTRTKYHCDNLKVVNGTVVQGTGTLINANTTSMDYAGLYLTGSNHEVAGINIIYQCPQAWGAVANASSASIEWHHNMFLDKGPKIVDRNGNACRSMGFRYPEISPNQFRLHNNLIKRTRQNGLKDAGFMYNNEIYVDSWSTNSFAIQPLSVPGEVGGEHYNNKIFATGFNPYGFGWAHESLSIHDNFINMYGFDLSARWINVENWGDINMLCGLRLTNYAPGGQVRNNIDYAHNTIVIRGIENCEIRGVEFFTDETIQNLIFHDSHIKVEALDAATTLVACVDTHGYYNKPLSKPCYYNNNLFESNMYHIRMGDSYGRGLYHMFKNCEFVRLGNRSDYHTFVGDGAYWSYGHVLTDCVFGAGTAPDDVYWKYCSSASWYAIAWTLSLTTAPNASVEIKDKDKVVRFTGTADANGRLSVGLNQYKVHPLEWVSTDADGTGRNIASGNKLSHQHQQFNNYTVTVYSGGDSISQPVTMDQAKSLTLMP